MNMGNYFYIFNFCNFGSKFFGRNPHRFSQITNLRKMWFFCLERIDRTLTKDLAAFEYVLDICFKYIIIFFLYDYLQSLSQLTKNDAELVRRVYGRDLYFFISWLIKKHTCKNISKSEMLCHSKNIRMLKFLCRTCSLLDIFCLIYTEYVLVMAQIFES